MCAPFCCTHVVVVVVSKSISTKLFYSLYEEYQVLNVCFNASEKYFIDFQFLVPDFTIYSNTFFTVFAVMTPTHLLKSRLKIFFLLTDSVIF